MNEQWVHAAGERASSARNGGRSLLHTLLVGSHYGWSWRPSLSVRAFSRLSAAFPELTKLTLDAVAGFSSIGMPGPAWLPMPQLRELRVNALGTFLTCHYVNTAQLTDFLAHIAAAAPDLRILHLKRGQQHISGADAARGMTAAPLPRVGAAISGVGTLQRLEELHLDTVEMLHGEMAGCDLPLLRVLKLSECGPQAAAAAVVLAAAAPQLQELSISMGFQRHGISMAHGATGAGSKPSADVESDLSGLRSTSLSTLTLSPVPAPCVSASLLGIARSGGCPSLSSIKCINAAYPCFDTAAPFPRLASLDLGNADNAALLANLRRCSARSRCRSSAPEVWLTRPNSPPRLWPTHTMRCAATARSCRRCASSSWRPRQLCPLRRLQTTSTAEARAQAATKTATSFQSP